jgi:hypothetical protein
MSEQSTISPVVNVVAESSLENDNVVRYQFTLQGYAGETSRTFIIDVPPTDIGTTDVWVHDSIVEVGDTPMDGFATFSPADTTDKAYREHHDGVPVESFVAAHPVELIEAGFTIGTLPGQVKVTAED